MTSETEKKLLLRVAANCADEARARRAYSGVSAVLLRGLEPDELDTISRVLREAAEGGWRPLPPPNDMDIIVLHDNGNSEFIPAEDNSFRWKENYGPRIDGIVKPILWMPLPPPPSTEATNSQDGNR